jgi:hypothetical protein
MRVNSPGPCSPGGCESGFADSVGFTVWIGDSRAAAGAGAEFACGSILWNICVNSPGAVPRATGFPGDAADCPARVVDVSGSPSRRGKMLSEPASGSTLSLLFLIASALLDSGVGSGFDSNARRNMPVALSGSGCSGLGVESFFVMRGMAPSSSQGSMRRLHAHHVSVKSSKLNRGPQHSPFVTEDFSRHTSLEVCS